MKLLYSSVDASSSPPPFSFIPYNQFNLLEIIEYLKSFNSHQLSSIQLETFLFC